MVQGELYRTMREWLLLKWVSLDEGSFVLKVHLGICGAHVGVNALVRKIMRYGYF